MYNYDAIYNKIQNLYSDGKITYEKAVEINDIAYDRYLSDINSENVVGESARSKYVNIIADKQAKVKKQMDDIKSQIANATDNTDVNKLKETLADLRDKYDKLADEASEYSAKVGKATGNAEQKNVRDGHLYSHKITDDFKHTKRYDADRDEDEKEHAKLDEKHDLSKLRGKNGKINLGTGKDSGSDHGEYNRYGTRSYRQSDVSHDRGAKRNFNNINK